MLLNDNLNVHAGMGLVNHTTIVDDNFRTVAYGTPILGGEYNFIPKKPLISGYSNMFLKPCKCMK